MTHLTEVSSTRRELLAAARGSVDRAPVTGHGKPVTFSPPTIAPG